jgi:ring-1,2-phenylacetyl-CoA epoxidase subunit PaaB
MSNKSQGPVWEVFIQASPGIPHKHAGSVHAPDAEMALQNARDVYTRRKEGINIWVVEAKYITASSPDDSGAFFDPANDKIYRHPTFYSIPEGVKYL